MLRSLKGSAFSSLPTEHAKATWQTYIVQINVTNKFNKFPPGHTRGDGHANSPTHSGQSSILKVGTLHRVGLVRAPLNPSKGSISDGQQQLAFKLSNLIFHQRGRYPSHITHHSTGEVSSSTCQRTIIFVEVEKSSRGGSGPWKRIEHQQHVGVRFVHLTDSLVCLHCLSRGRSSSRKLRRTMSRINGFSPRNAHPVWGYVHTDQNPADKPSRWHRRIRTKFRNAA